jgi:predicted nicotinamide N-methyase
MTPEEFVRSHTSVGTTPLVPEVRLHLAERYAPVWEASEVFGAAEQAPPFWAFAWPGGAVLARYALDHAELVRGKRVLDFGAGGGIAGVAAALAGAAHVLASDLDPIARTAIGLNAALNGVAVDTCGDVLATPPEVDVVLAGDVCYERSKALGVLGWLRAHAARGAHVLLADPHRGFFQLKDEPGVERVQTRLVRANADVEGREELTTTLWRVHG